MPDDSGGPPSSSLGKSDNLGLFRIFSGTARRRSRNEGDPSENGSPKGRRARCFLEKYAGGPLGTDQAAD